MRVQGELTVTVKYGSQCQELLLVVIAGNGPPQYTGTKLASTSSFGLGTTKIGYRSHQH